VTGHEPRTTNHKLPPALQFECITKSFFGVPVLKGVSFALPAGHTLGLVGENGAGKSTLMNILGGNLRPDDGRMLLDEAPYVPASPQDATRAGVAFIHQELNLFPNLSIAENLFLTAFPRRGGLIRRRAIRERAQALLNEVGLQLPSDSLIERLSAGERQLVEIAKALSIEPRLVILDEPTTSLTARETEHLFALLGRLRARGIAMIYISHALNDVLRLCDDIVVLRDGDLVGRGPREEWTIERMISLMVGREIEQLFPERHREERSMRKTEDAAPPPHAPSSAVQSAGSAAPAAPAAQGALLEVRSVTQPGIVRDVSFTILAGEVVGISGLMGSGRTELARIRFGLDPLERGEILLAGEPIERLSPRERIARGLAFLTESRRDEGLCMEASIADNLSLAALGRYAHGPAGWLDRAALTGVVRTVRQAVTLTASARDAQPVKTLSGGNQQKVVLAKWLLNEPRVFILDEPTRGIDVGAKYEVYTLINQLAERGAGILMISSEIEELTGMCDRILVMSRGEIRDEINCQEFDRERILKAALHEGHSATTAEEGGRGT
jgi:ribose transport system ATP-binding protein